MKRREESPSPNLFRISVESFSIISSSLRKPTSRLVGWMLTSTRCGSIRTEM